MSDIHAIVQKQRDFFSTQQTKDMAFRIDQLKTLKKAILDYEEKIIQAVHLDLHRSQFDGYVTEVGLCVEYIDQALRNIKKWARPKTVRTSKLAPFGRGSVVYEPLGISLIIAPWNYPFNLAVGPMIYSMAAGNCIVLKPSRSSTHINQVIQDMIANTFDEKYIAATALGNRDILVEKYDHICFTGGPAVGRDIMKAAAANLTPVLLELGGKSPCIVHQDADIDKAAGRLVAGKFFNAGQTCIAPDYVLVHKSVKNALVEKCEEKIVKFYGVDPQQSPDFCRIIDQDTLKHLLTLLKDVHVIRGGQSDVDDRYLAPTLVDQIPEKAAVMQEEIFGPILPILEYETIDEAIDFVNKRLKPLAMYIFTNDRALQKKIIYETSSGGVTVNDTLMHFTDSDMPFGGVGESGHGRYHGFSGFASFSNPRGVLYQTTLFDIPMRYPPATPTGLKLIKWLFG